MRDGSRPKTALTEATGQVTIEVPRDRGGSFQPQIVKKRQRRLAGVDETVLSLYVNDRQPRKTLGPEPRAIQDVPVSGRGGLGCGEVDEAGLDRGDLPRQLGGVRALEQRGQFGGLLGGKSAGVDESLVRSAGLVVDADALPIPVRSVADRFGGPGEQVQPDPDECVGLVQQP